jgi:hypothetical protein
MLLNVRDNLWLKVPICLLLLYVDKASPQAKKSIDDHHAAQGIGYACLEWHGTKVLSKDGYAAKDEIHDAHSEI